jgi:hypothetical protein
MSMIIDGTNGLTFNNSTVQASAGQVLQVVNATSNTYTTTTSTSFTTIITATITPKFTTSKVLVLCNANGLTGTTINISFNNNAGTVLGYVAQYGASSINYSSGSAVYLDSPASTSALSYTLRLASTSGGSTARINDYATSPTTSTLTLMEIAG